MRFASMIVAARNIVFLPKLSGSDSNTMLAVATSRMPVLFHVVKAGGIRFISVVAGDINRFENVND